MSLALHVTPTSTASSEHTLVAAVRRGDDRAFEELYARYGSRIGSYVKGMVGDHGRAEDVSQEVFISALRRMRNTERPIAFKPWIYEIAKNACIDHFRRTRRTQEVSLDGEDALQSIDRGKLMLAATPEAAVESKARLDDLRGAFGGLSDTHHRVLVMRELEGLSYAEIGERLGLSRPVVESTLFRARKRLQEEYEELVSGRRCERVREVVHAEREHALQPLGVRERRRLAKHLAHCQPCRRFACLAGFDDAVLQAPGLTKRIAALLPIPWLRERLAARDSDVSTLTGSHPLVVGSGLDTAARFVDSIGATVAGAPLATAAAVLALAGGGAGVVGATAGGSPRQPVAAPNLADSHGVRTGDPARGAPAGVLSAMSRTSMPGASVAFGGGAAVLSASSGQGRVAGGQIGGGSGVVRPGSPTGHVLGGTTANPPGTGVPKVPVPTVPSPSLPQPTLPPVSLPPTSALPTVPPLPTAPPLRSVPPVRHVPSVSLP
jgi:RNA polymerase sigma factor (sigma-70 family)